VPATAATYSVPDLVRDLREIVANTTDNREIIRQVMPLARRISGAPSLRRKAFYACDEAQGMGINILHVEPDNTLLVEAIAWMPGRGVKPHDHQTWGVVVGLDGHETNVNWRRLDDKSRPGYAELEVQHEIVVKQGDIVAFLPDDIHSVRNDGDTTTLSLHIYGKSLAHIDRSEFDPEAGIQRPCPKRVRRQV
jgi:predicted metal-dependent enzyme (double-stranded beta helix superfamily)